MKVICDSRNEGCPDGCPHKVHHEKDEQCERGFCSYKGHSVVCIRKKDD